ncbi:MAG: glycerophosphodiester phosphodiesterase [Thermoanaerobaculia bacterium]
MDSVWTQPHPLWIVGHRGAPLRARENTLDSFDFAESMGADAIELDLRQTRDFDLVVFHDEQIPIGTELHPVRGMASHDVRELLLDSPSGEYRIPTFEQVLQRYGTSIRYVVEIKTSASTDRVRAASRVAGLLGAFGCLSRALVASFDPELLRRVRERETGVALSFLIDRPISLAEGETPPCEAIGPRTDLVDAGFVERISATGRSVHAWTADSPEEIERLASLGVASITTNDCDLARSVLRA